MKFIGLLNFLRSFVLLATGYRLSPLQSSLLKHRLRGFGFDCFGSTLCPMIKQNKGDFRTQASSNHGFSRALPAVVATFGFFVQEQMFLMVFIGTICFDVQNPKASCRESVSSVRV